MVDTLFPLGSRTVPASSTGFSLITAAILKWLLTETLKTAKKTQLPADFLWLRAGVAIARQLLSQCLATGMFAMPLLSLVASQF
jgi:hypothetical protein